MCARLAARLCLRVCVCVCAHVLVRTACCVYDFCTRLSNVVLRFARVAIRGVQLCVCAGVMAACECGRVCLCVVYAACVTSA